MIRKLNTPTAILLVTCLTFAPAALAADGPGGAWYSEVIEIVKEWVIGGDETNGSTEVTDKKALEETDPSDESGPVFDPAG